jgi:hypothetical protein
MEKYCLQQFSDKFHEFMSNLNIIFKDDDELTNFNKSVDRINMTKLAIRYTKVLSPFKDKLENKDESMFANELFLLPTVNMSRLWNSGISDKTKNVFWQHIQLLYVLGNIIDNGDVNNDMLNNMIDEMDVPEESDKNSSDPANIMSSLGNMDIGNLMNGLSNFDEKDIAEASTNIKKIFGDEETETSNLMCDMVTDISKELTNNNSEGGGINNIIKIAENIAEKFKPKLESGDFDINELLGTAQNAMGQLYGGSQEANPLNDMLSQLMGQVQGSMANQSGQNNQNDMISQLMGQIGGQMDQNIPIEEQNNFSMEETVHNNTSVSVPELNSTDNMNLVNETIQRLEEQQMMNDAFNETNEGNEINEINENESGKKKRKVRKKKE